jgi:hypothetical protein
MLQVNAAARVQARGMACYLLLPATKSVPPRKCCQFTHNQADEGVGVCSDCHVCSDKDRCAPLLPAPVVATSCHLVGVRCLSLCVSVTCPCLVAPCMSPRDASMRYRVVDHVRFMCRRANGNVDNTHTHTHMLTTHTPMLTTHTPMLTTGGAG